MPRRAVLVTAILAVAMVLVPFSHAEADVRGSFPPPATRGVASVLFSGGSVAQFINELVERGCGPMSFSVYRDGKQIVYVPTTPDFVNAEFLELFPVFQMPAGQILIVACQEGAVGGPTPFEYACGGAEFIVDGWRNMPSQLTDVSPVPQPEIYFRYRLPAEATGVRVSVNIETSVGNIPPGTIQKVVPEYPEGANASLGTNIGAGAIPGLTDGLDIADGEWHSSTLFVNLPTEEFFNGGHWDRTLPPGWRYSDYSPPPFLLLVPPSINGFIEQDGVVWVFGFNLPETDYCFRLK